MTQSTVIFDALFEVHFRLHRKQPPGADGDALERKLSINVLLLIPQSLTRHSSRCHRRSLTLKPMVGLRICRRTMLSGINVRNERCFSVRHTPVDRAGRSRLN